ncbi:TolC family protein [Sphingomonas sp. BK580]|uniref:TolC family protein n=1 Tax=Sphingomonas sp. BK580 TaxID=2586972 RepID=UPI0021A44DFE|nr:TolC family protein [Sphingomonas sp. BK580]
MSYEAASTRLDGTSPGLSGRGHEVSATRATAAATKALRRPLITATASVIEYQKTLSLDLSGPRATLSRSSDDLLGRLSSDFPPGSSQIAAEVIQRLGAALPGLIGSIPDEYNLRTRDAIFRPTVQGLLPLYTGGAIGAIQKGADHATQIAEAEDRGGRDLARVGLVRAYFGQLLAVELASSSAETLASFERHLADATRMERAGMLAHARTLEVQVARDAAARAQLRAESEEASARDALARMLDMPAGVEPSSPLFVQSAPLASVGSFIESVDGTPRVQGADAARRLSRSGVDLAKSRFLPQVFAFGEYNLDRDQALATEPDWIVGVTARMTLLSNVDRRATLLAAQEREKGAADAAAQARKDVAGDVVKAWNLVDAARRSFLLLESGLAAAAENLRVQRASFVEGESPAGDLVSAEATLANARAQRAAAAFEYDLALVSLLAASHRIDEFGRYLRAADHHVETRR